MKIFERVNIEKSKYLLSLKKYEFEEFFPRTEDFARIYSCKGHGEGG